MIKNDRQYKITKKRIADFERALADLAGRPPVKNVTPRLARAQREAIDSQLVDLRDEVADYENLKTGKDAIVHVEGVLDIPIVLIKARIARGLTQKGLGELIGLKEQQIQRYEADNYQTATVSRIAEVAAALNVKIHEDIDLRLDSAVRE